MKYAPVMFMPIRPCRTLFLTAGFLCAHWLAAQTDRAEALQNPFAGQATAIAAGKTLYSAQCQNCHATAISTFQRGGADGEIFLNIRNGIRNTTMPPFAQLNTDQI